MTTSFGLHADDGRREHILLGEFFTTDGNGGHVTTLTDTFRLDLARSPARVKNTAPMAAPTDRN